MSLFAGLSRCALRTSTLTRWTALGFNCTRLLKCGQSTMALSTPAGSMLLQESFASGRFTALSMGSILWEQLSVWFIKRTFQPSIMRKRRKQGFLTRQKTVGGRRVLKRRQMKGRKRLGGC